jgi:hypothetical protein
MKPALYCWSFALLLSACTVDNSGTPIDDIDPDKKLVDLDDGERQGVCTWGMQIAADKLPASGSRITCAGESITWNGATDCKPVPTQCKASVSEWRECLPNFFDRIGADPCVLLEFALPNDVQDYVEATPGCAGVGPCATAAM